MDTFDEAATQEGERMRKTIVAAVIDHLARGKDVAEEDARGYALGGALGSVQGLAQSLGAMHAGPLSQIPSGEFVRILADQFRDDLEKALARMPTIQRIVADAFTLPE